jgi:hypothetical protein
MNLNKHQEFRKGNLPSSQLFRPGRRRGVGLSVRNVIGTIFISQHVLLDFAHSGQVVDGGGRGRIQGAEGHKSCIIYLQFTFLLFKLCSHVHFTDPSYGKVQLALTGTILRTSLYTQSTRVRFTDP